MDYEMLIQFPLKHVKTVVRKHLPFLSEYGLYHLVLPINKFDYNLRP